ETAGVGVDLPPQQGYPRVTAGSGTDSIVAISEDDTNLNSPSRLFARGTVFRRRHRLYGPFILYGGRIDPGKGCEELIQYFSNYVKDGGDATLVLMGVKLMSLPEEPFIRFAGLLSEPAKLHC